MLEGRKEGREGGGEGWRRVCDRRRVWTSLRKEQY